MWEEENELMGAIYQMFKSVKDFGIGWRLLETNNAPGRKTVKVWG